MKRFIEILDNGTWRGIWVDSGILSINVIEAGVSLTLWKPRCLRSVMLFILQIERFNVVYHSL